MDCICSFQVFNTLIQFIIRNLFSNFTIRYLIRSKRKWQKENIWTYKSYKIVSPFLDFRKLPRCIWSKQLDHRRKPVPVYLYRSRAVTLQFCFMHTHTHTDDLEPCHVKEGHGTIVILNMHTNIAQFIFHDRQSRRNYYIQTHLCLSLSSSLLLLSFFLFLFPSYFFYLLNFTLCLCFSLCLPRSLHLIHFT